MRWVQKPPRFTIPIIVRFNLKTFSSIGIQNLPALAIEIISQGQSIPIWAFYGEMGSGKTTLIKSICSAFGITEPVSSPTFSLVNEYRKPTGEIIYHFDFYRIKSIEEVFDMGYEEYFESGHLCLIEWPEKIESLLQQEMHLAIKLEKETEDLRKVQIETIQPL